MKFQKGIALALAAASLAAFSAGCSNKAPGEVEGKINVSIGGWPAETNPESLERQNKMKDVFMEQNQDINIIPDTYNYDTKTFTLKATAGQLPTAYKVWFTEIQQIIKQGYAADVTEFMDKYGFTDSLNPMLLDFVKDSEGKLYGLPTDGYAQGLYINKKLFREAGLVNADGSVKVPQTYQEVAEFAQIIKEKTGKAGLVLPTTNNAGGWQFLNVAWSYGADFCEQDADGKWKSILDSQAARDALQYYKDLKWKYNALMDETVITQSDLYKWFGTYNAAMMIANPPCGGLSGTYDMEISDIYVTRMPEGPAGRYSQMGGNLWMFSTAATPEQLDACFKWIIHTGFSPELSDEQLANLKTGYQNTISNNGIVLDQSEFPIWVNPERMEKEYAAKREYANVNHEDYAEFYAFEGVTIKPEPAACAQQLYSIMDGAIQEVFTNENADVDKLIAEASVDYQVNHLDKM